MFPFTLPRIFPTVHADSDELAVSARTVSTLRHVRNAMAVPETEIKRWRRAFDVNAQTVVDGQKYVARVPRSCVRGRVDTSCAGT